MSFQAYLDNVKAKTGKTPDDFAKLAAEKGLASHGDIVKWLKSDFALRHGHATAIAGVVRGMGTTKARPGERLEKLFRGKKQHWRHPCDLLIGKVKKLAPDTEVAVGGTYVSLLRAGKKFAILQPSAADRLDIGIKLTGDVPTEGRLEPAGRLNAMVTHRVKIHEAGQIDEQVRSWLKRAYDAIP